MQEPRPSFLEVLRSIEDLIAEITGLNCIVEMFEDEGRQMFSIPRRTPVYCKHVSDLLGERAPCAKPNGCGEAGRSGRRASPRIFTCNAGMSSVVVPLSAGGEVVGEVLYGPVLMRLGGTTDAAFEAARALAEEHDLSRSGRLSIRLCPKRRLPRKRICQELQRGYRRFWTASCLSSCWTTPCRRIPRR